MSTYPSIDWTKHGSTTPNKYRFVLSFVLHSENGTLELDTAPLEWKDIELLLKRDPDTHGVYMTAVVNSLTFVKEGKNLIEELYASKGLFSQCSLVIYYLDFVTREYISMPSTYKLDFNTRRLVNLTKTTNGVQINCLAEGIISKFQQRKSTVVDLNKLVNIDGGTIIPSGIGKILQIPAINVYKSANFTGSVGISGSSTETGNHYIYPSLSQISSEIPESTGQLAYQGVTRDYSIGILHNVPATVTTILNGVILLNINSLTSTVLSMNVRLSVVNSSDTETDGITLVTYTSGQYSGLKTIAVSRSLVVPVGQSLSINIIITVNTSFSFNFSFDGTELLLQQSYLASTAVNAESLPLYEAIERNLQHITGMQYPLYSDFFGRVDAKYNVAEDTYLAGNQLRFANLLTGLNIRGGALSDGTMPMKFTDLFKALKSIWCVGGGFEIKDGGLVYRIEELDYFYKNSECLDLSAKVNILEVEREQNSEFMFSKIKTGYSKFEYEAIMGRGEYNTQNQRTTVVPNDNEFDNMCPLRADTRGVLAMRLKPLDINGSEDVTGDNDVFILKSQQTGAVWICETDENVAVENGTSLFYEGSLNLYLTPVRNLIRNGKIVNTGLGFSPGAKLTYQTSDKNNILRTTGEGFTISENEDIEAVDLPAPLWMPELLTIEVPFYESDFVTLSENPLEYVTLGENLSGWVMDVKWKFAQNIATLKLIRRIPI